MWQRYWQELFFLIWCVAVLVVFFVLGVSTNYKGIFGEYFGLRSLLAPLCFLDIGMTSYRYAAMRLRFPVHSFLLKRFTEPVATRVAGRIFGVANVQTKQQILRRFFQRQGAIILGFAVMLVVLTHYTHIKNIIPLINGHLWDGLLFDIDKWLFFGWVPSELVQSQGRDFRWFPIWSFVYIQTFMNLFFGIACLVLYRDHRDIYRFFRCNALIYILAITFSVAFPSAGPAFINADYMVYPVCPMFDVQKMLYNTMQAAIASPSTFLPRPFMGISAFPSVHVAMAFLPCCFFMRQQRLLQLIFVPWACLVAVSTVALGAHYAVDAPGGVLFTWLAYKLSSYTRKTTA